MIVDCHGHYTTAPQSLWDWRKRQAAGERPRVARAADRVARWFVGGLLLLALVTALAWWQLDASKVLGVPAWMKAWLRS